MYILLNTAYITNLARIFINKDFSQFSLHIQIKAIITTYIYSIIHRQNRFRAFYIIYKRSELTFTFIQHEQSASGGDINIVFIICCNIKTEIQWYINI